MTDPRGEILSVLRPYNAAKSWEDVADPNRSLMIAVAGEVLRSPELWAWVRERLLTDEAVEAASRDFEPSTWEAFDEGSGREFERTDALADARSAVSAALAHAEQEKDR